MPVEAWPVSFADPKITASSPQGPSSRRGLGLFTGWFGFSLFSLFSLCPPHTPPRVSIEMPTHGQPLGPRSEPRRRGQAGCALFHFWNSSGVRAALAVSSAQFTEAGCRRREDAPLSGRRQAAGMRWQRPAAWHSPSGGLCVQTLGSPASPEVTMTSPLAAGLASDIGLRSSDGWGRRAGTASPGTPVGVGLVAHR